MNKLDLTVIIPVHSVVDPNFKAYLDSALTSINNNKIKPEKVLIVRCACTDVRDELATVDFTKFDLNIEVVENSTGKSLQKQVNFGVEQTKTKFFTFLEFDDQISITWLKNVKTYSETFPDVNMFLPIISNVDPEDKFYGYGNEAAWAMNFSDRLGYLDLETILSYPTINLSGMVVKTEAFKAVEGYKPSIKLSFNYELLLRFLHNGNIVMVIPKIGYRHINFRPTGLYWDLLKSEQKMTPAECMFWMDLAKKEYYYKTDRNIAYVNSSD